MNRGSVLAGLLIGNPRLIMNVFGGLTKERSISPYANIHFPKKDPITKFET